MFPSPDGVMAFKGGLKYFIEESEDAGFRPLMGLWPLKDKGEITMMINRTGVYVP